MIPGKKVKRRQLFLLLLILSTGLLTLCNREPLSAGTPPPTFLNSSSLIRSQSSLIQSQSQSSPSSRQSTTPLSETDRFRALMESRIERIGKHCEILKLGWGWWLSNKTFEEKKLKLKLFFLNKWKSPLCYSVICVILLLKSSQVWWWPSSIVVSARELSDKPETSANLVPTFQGDN